MDDSVSDACRGSSVMFYLEQKLFQKKVPGIARLFLFYLEHYYGVIETFIYPENNVYLEKLKW